MNKTFLLKDKKRGYFLPHYSRTEGRDKLKMMNFKINQIVLILFIILSLPTQAGVRSFFIKNIYFDIHTSFGKGKSEVTSDDISSEIYQYGLGSTIGWKMRFLYLGMSYDYFKVAQSTETEGNVGNRGGFRSNVLSPTLGLSLGRIRFKFDYQMKGNYKLDQKTALGENISYEGPSGYRIYGGIRIRRFFDLGIFYENIAYEREVVNGNSFTLKDKLKVSQFGPMVIVPF